jgi:hypothetical protein
MRISRVNEKTRAIMLPFPNPANPDFSLLQNISNASYIDF